MHTTGVGKVLLAHAPDEVRREAFQQLTRVTPYSIVQPGQLRAELDRVRRDGYAQTHEEMSLGACSVAVPILAPDGTVVASLGIVVANLKRDRPRLLAALQVAAQGVSRNIPG
jgi:DNA-binding IclR family transcriptional regulator